MGPYKDYMVLMHQCTGSTKTPHAHIKKSQYCVTALNWKKCKVCFFTTMHSGLPVLNLGATGDKKT